MFIGCRHVLPTGYKCKSPALRGRSACYFHSAPRRYANIAASSTSADPLLPPPIEDTAGVQVVLNQVLRALGSHRINRRHAGVFICGLQIAARLARESDKLSKPVREVCEDSVGGTLAPEKSICEPPADCIHCGRRSFCEDFENYKEDVEEFEERLQAEREANESEAHQANGQQGQDNRKKRNEESSVIPTKRSERRNLQLLLGASAGDPLSGSGTVQRFRMGLCLIHRSFIAMSGPRKAERAALKSSIRKGNLASCSQFKSR